MKGGIAERHFKWPEKCIKLLRRDIDIFIYTFLPPGFIAIVAINSDIPGHDEGLGRLAFVIASLALAVYFSTAYLAPLLAPCVNSPRARRNR
jgi:hypothetical protein